VRQRAMLEANFCAWHLSSNSGCSHRYRAAATKVRLSHEVAKVKGSPYGEPFTLVTRILKN
jgi:hypothetical protein